MLASLLWLSLLTPSLPRSRSLSFARSCPLLCDSLTPTRLVHSDRRRVDRPGKHARVGDRAARGAGGGCACSPPRILSGPRSHRSVSREFHHDV
eukprot:3763688-Rhodomonas_salina.1